MPGLVQGSDVDDHDPAITEALEQFCSAPEQTYEQFLSTFTYLTPENVKDLRLTDPRRHSPHSEIDSREEQREDGVSAIEENTLHSRHSVTADLEEVVLDAGCVGGRLGGVGRPNPDRPVKNRTVHCPVRSSSDNGIFFISVSSHAAGDVIYFHRAENTN